MKPELTFVLGAGERGRALSASTESCKRPHSWLERLLGMGRMPVRPLILLALLVVIGPIVYAVPDDSTRIAGIYDAADDDDVIGSVNRGTNAVGDLGATVAGQPLSAAVARLAPSFGAVSDIGVLLGFCLRSPPDRLNPQFDSDWMRWRMWQRPEQGNPGGAFLFWSLLRRRVK